MVTKPKRVYDKIKTVVKRILYYNQKTRWGVLSVKNTLPEDPFFKEKTLILTGNFSDVYVNCEIIYSGEFAVHNKYGSQIAITNLVVSKDLVKKDAVVRFLIKSGIKGISVQHAEKIFETFGSDSIKIVLNQPERLKEIKGIGEGTYNMVLSSIEEYKKSEALIEYCASVGIPYNLMHRLQKTMEPDEALKLLKEDIYSIIPRSESITFAMVDDIALKSGVAPDDPKRLRACLTSCLIDKVVMSSSTGCNSNELKVEFIKKIGISDNNLYTSVLNQLRKEKVAYVEGSHIYYEPYYRREEFIAEALTNMMNTRTSFEFTEDDYKEATSIFPFELNEGQKSTIQNVLNSRVAVLTGGPGSGKSTITKAIVHLLKSKKLPFVLLSPTGKATRRMEECIGEKAQTIHKYLRVKKSIEDACVPDDVKPNTVYLIDESSMMDILMLSKLLEISTAYPISMIFIGDKDQLPSVQAGNVLADVIVSNEVPVFMLTDIMRQAKDSHIIEYCSYINKGKHLKPCKHDDFVYEEYEDEADLINDLQDIYMAEVKKNGLQDVQVIAPYKRGILGVNQLNVELSDYYNDNELDESTGFKIGDKVMQLCNDYQKDIFNGEVGVIEAISEDGVEVKFNDNIIKYQTEDLPSIMQAYACTCHKSQGAEYSTVVVVLDNSNGNFLLTRKLLYTATSRGKKKVYILSKPDCLDRCIDNTFETPRITKLADFLRMNLA